VRVKRKQTRPPRTHAPTLGYIPHLSLSIQIKTPFSPYPFLLTLCPPYSAAQSNERTELTGSNYEAFAVMPPATMTLSGLRSSARAPRLTVDIFHAGRARVSTQLRCRGFSSYLVTPKELSIALSKNPPTKISTSPRTIPLCAAWFMPNDPHGRTGFSAFQAERIPTARFFDLDAIKDHNSPYPHMLPTAETFAKAMGELGIRRDDDVVVYDASSLGIFSAPRVCWTLKVFGHNKVFLLNNFKLWVEQGFPTETGDVRKVEVTNYPAPDLDVSKVVAFDEVKDIVKDLGKEGAEGVQILDARPYGRWAGKDPEPRKGE
jgi:thiosulfate/3-mercaptopyruvate sulfurtransferase